ncbi:hypothetical protein BJI67_03280 [Acidihalobacter aeolianus]|uniref:GGDEF domain-containing protein n=1 Tax=Acidihalobacter aeolianus TaxID=2792603 RepID=A0A1D8K5K0_9GAMM|nr:sensor domain-containing diguanylate cyclase [Acidihalobacter aeolianus]AOV16224.1 hypothetical protein BJI67_03280 [Acidihalobacter aeolianus]
MHEIVDDPMKLTLSELNLLRARPSQVESRVTRWVMLVLILLCLAVLPFATDQWRTTHLFYAAAGIASFVEVATGILLLTQVSLLRHDAGLALGMGYLLGGAIICINLLLVHDTATRLWLFRLWHGVFTLSVLAYAILQRSGSYRFRRDRFHIRRRWALFAGGAFLVLLVLYLDIRPFALPGIIHDGDYITFSNVLVNGIQLAMIFAALGLLLTAPRKTVLSEWMAVVACAVAIDIVLFVLGGRLFSVGLYASKVNNLFAATLVFGVIYYRLIRLQAEFARHRQQLVRANRRLQREALTDALTGLPNRAALEQRLEAALEQAKAAGTMLAVCVVDLDDFKPINDNYGHAIGDAVLSAFARRLSGVLRAGEYATRLGGDEFVLILEELDGQPALDAVMSRISDALDTAFSLPDGVEVRIGASIGVAVYPFIEDGRELLREADQALYRSKANKSGRERIWSARSTGARIPGG